MLYRDTFIVHQQRAINGPCGADACSSRKCNNVVGHISLIIANTFSGWLAPKGVEGVREGCWAISCPCVPLPPTPGSANARRRYIQKNFLLV